MEETADMAVAKATEQVDAAEASNYVTKKHVDGLKIAKAELEELAQTAALLTGQPPAAAVGKAGRL